jgi:hypothetical protein
MRDMKEENDHGTKLDLITLFTYHTLHPQESRADRKRRTCCVVAHRYSRFEWCDDVELIELIAIQPTMLVDFTTTLTVASKMWSAIQGLLPKTWDRFMQVALSRPFPRIYSIRWIFHFGVKPLQTNVSANATRPLVTKLWDNYYQPKSRNL